jgi:hypothetical protein
MMTLSVLAAFKYKLSNVLVGLIVGVHACFQLDLPEVIIGY